MENDVITKPAQYGSYVLGYSRRIMLFYNKIIDNDLNKFIVSYTDNDSWCDFNIYDNDILFNGDNINFSNVLAEVVFNNYELGVVYYP